MILAVHNIDNGEVMLVNLPKEEAIKTLVAEVVGRQDFREASVLIWHVDESLKKLPKLNDMVKIQEELRKAKAEKALEEVIKKEPNQEAYYEVFCEELEKLKVDQNVADYCELFEEALIQKGLV